MPVLSLLCFILGFMTLLDSYYVPGLYVEDHSVDVPLDWGGADGITAGSTGIPGGAGSGLKLFYRTVCAAGHAHDDMPLLLFLQGGPGGAGPRPYSADSVPWLAEAVKHYRVVLPDQRGTGRSSRIDSHIMQRFADDPRAGADYLHHFLADSVIRDFEYLRRSEFGGVQWTTLGQSYGGFLTLTYLSLHPEAVQASFITGGVMHIPGDPKEVYEHTVPRMYKKTQQYYSRYPQDIKRINIIADYISSHDVRLPNGDPFTVRRLQMLGGDFGMKPGYERMHWTIDGAFAGMDGSAPEGPGHAGDIRLSDGFLQEAMDLTSSYASPLYWPLQEFIYQNGDCAPAGWAASHVIGSDPRFSTDARPLAFIGEAALPEMFEEDSSLKPFRDLVNLMMSDTHWGTIYDAAQLAANEVPLRCAVYFDDMYVDSSLQLDTLSRVGNSHAWVTNRYEHDGARASADVFAHLYQEAMDHGDLDRQRQ